MSSKRSCALPAALLLAAASAIAQPAGTDVDITLCWGGTAHLSAASKELAFGTYLLTGTVRSATTGGMFDGSSTECGGSFEAAAGGGRHDGWCVFVDRQGDKWWGRDIRRGTDHRFEVLGGSGKYAGLTGSLTVERTLHPPVRPATTQGCSRTKGTLRTSG
jgi:hypothetical protein